MRAILLLFAGLAFVLGGCDAGKPTPETAQAAVKSYFESRLFDGPAARYRFFMPPLHGWFHSTPDYPAFVSYSDNPGWYMCGEINAKNRFGAYVGYTAFFVQFSPTAPYPVIVGEIANNDAQALLMVKWCKELSDQNP